MKLVEQTAEQKTFLASKMLFFLLGLFCYALGACLATKAGIGISPITSVSYIFSLITTLSLGTTTFVLNVVLVFAQVIMQGKSFDKRQYLQIPISIVFSLFVDATMLIANLFVPVSLVERISVFLMSMIIMAIGISLVVMSELSILPADGVAKTIASKLNMAFGKAKVINDSIMVTITIIVSLLWFQSIKGVHVGTVAAAFMLGNLARIIMNFFEPLAKWRA